MVENVIIIGSGPAGYTAALYTGRSLLNPLLIGGRKNGGQLMFTSIVENFPGYVNGIGGIELMTDLESQAVKFGTRVINKDVKNINTKIYPYKVTLDNEDVYYTKSVILATGSSPVWLNLENESKLKGRGVSTCATCDGAFFRDEQVIVVGGGDSAMEEAIFLTRYAKKVIIVHRNKTFRASNIMLDRARNNSKIDWKTESIVKKWLITDSVLSGVLLDTPKGEQNLYCTGAFIAIGHRPVTGFLNGDIKTDDHGYIITQKNTMTSIEGIFACGDVVDTRYKQAITAAGDGCKAALDLEKWLSENSSD